MITLKSSMPESEIPPQMASFFTLRAILQLEQTLKYSYTDRRSFSLSGSAKMIEEYLTIAELAERLKLNRKTIQNKMAAGVFRKGVHYFSPRGLGPRFKWSAVLTWLESCEHKEGSPITFPVPASKTN